MTGPTLDVSRVRAITLDLDDTLWPVWPTIERAEEALRAWLDERAPGAAALARDPDAQQAARRAARDGLRDNPHDLSALRRETIRHLLREADEDTTLAELAFEVFFEARHRVDLYPDALPALAMLSDRLPIVALSNGNADVHKIGLGQYFHGAVSASAVGIAKPDRRIFEAAADAAGVEPKHVLHVGDDALLDGIGALGAGMQTAWINRTDAPWVADGNERPHFTAANLVPLVECFLHLPLRKARTLDTE